MNFWQALPKPFFAVAPMADVTDLQLAAILVTHDLEEAVYLGSSIAVLSQYHTDDRGDDPSIRRGAKIVTHLNLKDRRAGVTTDFKKSKEIGELIQHIRSIGFDPTHRKHVREFDLSHQSSFQTLTPEENKPQI